MILKVMENPRIKGVYENVVVLTMTRDQFDMLKDCVSLAWQRADNDSRMFEISNLIRDDFEKLDIAKAYLGGKKDESKSK